jgi:hypothetical protein
MANQPGMVLDEPTQMFHLALTDAEIPIGGVATLHPAEEYPPDRHIVVRDDGLVVDISYLPEATPEQIVEGNDIVMTLDVTPRRVRTAWAIYADITALSTTQIEAIMADLKADDSAKIKGFGPPYDGIMMSLDWAATAMTVALPAAPGTSPQVRDAYARIAALYTQQNIYYLDTPDFDSTITIPGAEIIPPGQARIGLAGAWRPPSNTMWPGMG